MQFRQAIISINSKTYTLLPNRPNFHPEFYADFQQTEEAGGLRYGIFLHPKEDLTVRRLEVQFHLKLDAATRFFANGWQSWSESRAYFPHESIPRLQPIARPLMGLYGDEHIPGIPRGQGYLHSWSYTTVEGSGLKIAGITSATPNPLPSTLLLASLNERTGFTLFLYDHHNGLLTVRKDMDDLQLSHSFPALDFWVGAGKKEALLDAWFSLLELPQRAAPKAVGWTSWYRHFTNISTDLLMQNLEGLANSPLLKGNHVAEKPWFQIDDGWQTHVGDWLSVKKTFPQGPAKMAADIRAKGCRPGLWLAPFVASAKSDLVKRHPDWLLKTPKGKPLRVGWNPMWGGWYYALNFYHPQVQEYLTGVFHTALAQWGFELVKLDFLFAACLAPPPQKTRGQVMHDVMEFLRRLVGERKMLACGVPLGSAFGPADYCRIGGDVHLRWEHGLLRWLGHRERVSTVASLRNTLGRWPLHGRAFSNDPDVFILRHEHQHLSPAQQQMLLTINALLGNLLFTSDDLREYSAEQLAQLEAALALQHAQVQAVTEVRPEVWQIDFVLHDTGQVMMIDLQGK